jgi:D-alanyl-D-alanine carboxypeptidase/D-alanyl-D-alanine-endopeptidase (penicillin-binding protein 4)
MRQTFSSFFLLITFYTAFAQNSSSRFVSAFKLFEQDPSFKHATISLYIVDSKTGKPVFDKNSQTGLAPASCQKVITSAAAFEILGSDYQFKTQLGYQGKIDRGTLSGNLVLTGSGDPTLGSWRWTSTKEDNLLNAWTTAVKNVGITSISGTILFDGRGWGTETIPDGWIWQDIGNYYGAGASFLNWRENQYDLVLRSGKRLGDTCEIVRTVPRLYRASLTCEVTTAAKGTGDNAFIYLPPYAEHGIVRGTIPLGENAFSISGAFPDPAVQLRNTFYQFLQEVKITMPSYRDGQNYQAYTTTTLLHTYNSPPFDSINFYFMRRSINLYGEALLKTMGREKQGMASTAKGIETVRDFWSRQGIERAAIHILDGSGLSPQNRVTANALVSVMQYARTRPWFSSFYHSLPEINAIKMKSGSIGGARSYCGYIKARDGREYTFAFIVNNYEGSAGETVRKMWRVLDLLKNGGE